MWNSFLDLFPTRFVFWTFMLYTSLNIGQGIYGKTSNEKYNIFRSNTITVAFLSEVLKLFTSGTFYCQENDFISLLHDIYRNWNIMIWYFVPAFLYCMHGVLALYTTNIFINPIFYNLLLQFHVIITGVIFQLIFKTQLNRRQWISLIILTCGCMLQQVTFGDLSGEMITDSKTAAIKQHLITTSTERTTIGITAVTSFAGNIKGLNISMNVLLILLILTQVILSCTAIVCDEYLLKEKFANVNIFAMNVFMYIDSIVCNIIILLLRGQFSSSLSLASLRSIGHFRVIVLILNNMAVGIVTSFFLKYLNAILKTIANALELVIVPLICYFLYAMPIFLNTILAISTICYAINIYSQCPVINIGRVRPRKIKARNSLYCRIEAKGDGIDSDMQIV